MGSAFDGVLIKDVEGEDPYTLPPVNLLQPEAPHGAPTP